MAERVSIERIFSIGRNGKAADAKRIAAADAAKKTDGTHWKRRRFLFAKRIRKKTYAKYPAMPKIPLTLLVASTMVISARLTIHQAGRESI
jgi:hypothetical protein